MLLAKSHSSVTYRVRGTDTWEKVPVLGSRRLAADLSASDTCVLKKARSHLVAVNS